MQIKGSLYIKCKEIGILDFLYSLLLNAQVKANMIAEYQVY